MIEIKQFILRHLCEVELCQIFFDAYVKDYPKIHINPMIVLADIRKIYYNQLHCSNYIF